MTDFEVLYQVPWLSFTIMGLYLPMFFVLLVILKIVKPHRYLKMR